MQNSILHLMDQVRWTGHVSSLVKKIILFNNGRWYGISHGTTQSRENFWAPEHVPSLLMTSLDAEFNSALHRPSPMHRTYFQPGKKKLFYSLLVGDMVYCMAQVNPERISWRLSMSRGYWWHRWMQNSILHLRDHVRCTGHISNLVKKIIFVKNGSWHSLSYGKTQSRENFSVPEHVPSLLMTSLDAEFNSALHRPSPMHRTYFQLGKKNYFLHCW
jgi:hypothetical protein